MQEVSQGKGSGWYGGRDETCPISTGTGPGDVEQRVPALLALQQLPLQLRHALQPPYERERHGLLARAALLERQGAGG